MANARYAPDYEQAYPFIADATLTANMVVAFGSADGHVQAPSGSGATNIVGVTNNPITSGYPGDIQTGGVVKCVANGAITRGGFVVVATAAGDCRSYNVLTDSPAMIVGQAYESTSNSLDLFACKLLLTPPIQGDASVERQVRVVSSSNVALATALVAGQTIDGVTLVAGDRVLLANQTSASASGVYIATAAGTASYAPDYVQGAVKAGMVYEVAEGTTWAGSSWKSLAAQTSVGGYITVGTTDPLLYPRMFSATIAIGTPLTTAWVRLTAQPIALNDTTSSTTGTKAILVAGRGTGTITLTGTGTDSVNVGTFNW